MKLPFLLLAVFLAMEPVMSEECWKDGHCRLVCKEGEDSVIRCQNRKRCCVPDRYLTLQTVTVDGVLDWTTPTMSTPVHIKKKKKNHG